MVEASIALIERMGDYAAKAAVEDTRAVVTIFED